MRKLVIAGAGGHCRVVLDILFETEEYEIAGLVSKNRDDRILNVPVIGEDADLKQLRTEGIECGFVAIGDYRIRKRVQEEMKRLGFDLISPISRHAVVSRYAVIGRGTVVMPGAVINAGAVIGDGCIINTNCSVDHDCRIGDYTHIAPGAAVSGSTVIGRGCLIGTGARIIDRISIGDAVIVGAGAAVIRNIESEVTAVGVPASVIKQKI